MLGARRASTNKLYDGYLNLWHKFCIDNNINFLCATVVDGLTFLQQLKDDISVKRQYSALATARSAVSSVLNVNHNNCFIKFGEHPFVKQWMKGVEKEMPPKCRYLDIWDPDVVLNMFKNENWSPIDILSDSMLAKKLMMLLLLCTDNRGQLIVSLSLNNMVRKEDMIIFKLESSDLKQGRRGYVPELIKIKPFVDKDLCPVSHLNEYLSRTQHIRKKEDKVFLISRKPYNPVSRDTVSRWTSEVLRSAGIDIDIFSAGSTRAAAGSKANRKGVAMDTILKRGGWSQSSTFGRFYNKEVRSEDHDGFSDAVLSL